MNKIEKQLNKLLEGFKPEDQKSIRSAFEFSQKAHEGQMRKSGDPYITHPLETALILKKLHLEASTVAAALLHDVSEDTSTTMEDIKNEFGEEIAYLVEAMTKVSEVRLKGSFDPNYIENLRKMFIAAAQDLRVVLIRLADRLHNMRTIEYMDKEKQKSYAKETLEIFSPLANRLGIGEIKGELQDLAFPHVYPEEYESLTKKINIAHKARQKYVKKAMKTIEKLVKKNDVEIIDIHGRAKHLYSLYKKMQKLQTENLSRITDLMAIRIITPTTTDCYNILGLIHENFKPLPGNIKDYISVPKPNGYQSLHTTVFGPEGTVLEVQIRTPEMHEYAEHGVAAHWAYTEAGKPKKGFIPSKKFKWVQQLRDLQKELGSDPQEFINSLRLDLFQHRIFCFTPKGDVIDLPVGATPVDFAYAVHTDLGNHCIGAKVNNKMTKINTELNSGDVVEIRTSKKPAKISRDWLQFVKTSKARERVKKRLKGD